VTPTSTSSTGTLQTTALGIMPTDPKARLKKASHAMESLWISNMLKEARPKGGMFSKSFASTTFQDMMSDQLAQHIADTGLLGLSDNLSRQLLHTQNVINASKSAGNDAAASSTSSTATPSITLTGNGKK
jgi:Rod binding domain-containing protein